MEDVEDRLDVSISCAEGNPVSKRDSCVTEGLSPRGYAAFQHSMKEKATPHWEEEGGYTDPNQDGSSQLLPRATRGDSAHFQPSLLLLSPRIAAP